MKLTIAAIVSTIAAMVLCLGYFGRFGPTFYLDAGPTRDEHGLNLQLDSGSISLWLEKYQAATATQAQGGFRVRWYGHSWHPKFRDRVWKPSVGRGVVPDSSGGTLFVTIVDIPIVYSLTACLIAPLLWLRRRRLRKQPAGFAVVTDEKR